MVRPKRAATNVRTESHKLEFHVLALVLPLEPSTTKTKFLPCSTLSMPFVLLVKDAVFQASSQSSLGLSSVGIVMIPQSADAVTLVSIMIPAHSNVAPSTVYRALTSLAHAPVMHIVWAVKSNTRTHTPTAARRLIQFQERPDSKIATSMQMPQHH
jgi:hypothetical protein